MLYTQHPHLRAVEAHLLVRHGDRAGCLPPGTLMPCRHTIGGMSWKLGRRCCGGAPKQPLVRAARAPLGGLSQADG